MMNDYYEDTCRSLLIPFLLEEVEKGISDFSECGENETYIDLK